MINNHSESVKTHCPYCGRETTTVHHHSGLCPTCHNSLYGEQINETCRQCLQDISCIDCGLDIL